MIRNRLSILLAERELKITQVARDTGISRNTITSTSQNDGKMIQLETINTLCNYLKISPGDFFAYTPYEFESKSTVKNEYYEENKSDVIDTRTSLEITNTLTGEKNSIVLEGFGEYENVMGDLVLSIKIKITHKPFVEIWSNIVKEIPVEFMPEIKMNIINELERKIIENQGNNKPEEMDRFTREVDLFIKVNI